MGRRRSPGLEWLDPEDRKQRQWALNYLWARDYLPDSKGPRSFIRDEEIQEIGNGMELDPKGREVLKLMKEAWRQKRRKDTNDSIQTCTFTLKTTTKANLKKIADGQKKNVTALLEALIDKAYKAHQAREKKQRPPQPIPAKAASNTFPGRRHLSGSDAESVRYPASSAESIHPDQKASLEPRESVNAAASASTYSPAPMPATNPTMPASTHHIEMVGQVPDIATAEEIAHSRRMLDLAIKDKLARKKARTRTSEVHAPQTGIPGTALHDPNIEPYPG